MSVVFAPGRQIWLISPQRWGDLKLSKHHYAEALAARGCQVCFIEPPSGPRGVRVAPSDTNGVRVVSYSTWFPYRLKFHAPRLFDRAMRRQARLLCAALGGPADLIWDFDNTGQFADLRSFGARHSLFHLVDAPARPSVGSKHADRLATLHPGFMLKSGVTGPVPVVGHGLAPVHADAARRRLKRPPPTGTEIAMVGNLAAVWTDWPVIAAMVARFPDRHFRLIGPLPDGTAPPALSALKAAPNCSFTGRLTPAQIAALGDKIAVWLIAFNDRVQGGPTDTHKMLEYFASGAPVLSSWLAAWGGCDLVTMAPKGDNAAMPAMPAMLETLLAKPPDPKMRRQRVQVALAATYATRLNQIEAILADPTS